MSCFGWPQCGAAQMQRLLLLECSMTHQFPLLRDAFAKTRSNETSIRCRRKPIEGVAHLLRLFSRWYGFWEVSLKRSHFCWSSGRGAVAQSMPSSDPGTPWSDLGPNVADIAEEKSRGRARMERRNMRCESNHTPAFAHTCTCTLSKLERML